MPIVCLLVLAALQVAVVVRDQLGVQLAAREAARAGSVSADPAGAAARAAESVGLGTVVVSVGEGDGTITAQVSYVEHTDVPLIGALLPDVTLTARVTMTVEPPP